MTIIGRVESLWRYPVKSMRGERMRKAYVTFAGLYGDRLYAIKSSAGDKGFPYLTGRELPQMLLYTPRFRNPDVAICPQFFEEAESDSPGLNACSDDPENLSLEVQTPSGKVYPIDSAELLGEFASGLPGQRLALLRSDRALTDCRPVS
ncbi:MAG: MOSC N-terminal beta barrel domain-containing protein, partial [Kiloniellales bacterium]|nr:MOSC N-terminal beta barrel domain-containing protein [Kiloniellales bacterium]